MWKLCRLVKLQQKDSGMQTQCKGICVLCRFLFSQDWTSARSGTFSLLTVLVTVSSSAVPGINRVISNCLSTRAIERHAFPDSHSSFFFPAARPEECVAERRLRTSFAAVIYVLLVVRSAVHRHQGTSSCRFLRLRALCVRFGRHWRQSLMDPVADGCHTASQSSSISPASRLPRTPPLQPASAIATSSCCKAGTPLSAISPHSHVAPCAQWPPSWRRVLRSWAAERTQSVSSFVRNSLGSPFLCKLPLCSPSLSCPALAVLLSVVPLSEERISC